MTSGGPVNQQCSGQNTIGRSYYQPVVDAASNYGVTLTLG